MYLSWFDEAPELALVADTVDSAHASANRPNFDDCRTETDDSA